MRQPHPGGEVRRIAAHVTGCGRRRPR
jgi:hypothetical protein